MEQARKIAEALIALMRAQKTNQAAGPTMRVQTPEGRTQPILDDTNRAVTETRKQAREVQPSDQLAEREAGRTLIGGGANTDAPGFDVGEAMVGIQGQLRHDPSRLPDQGGLDNDLVRVRPQDSPDPNIPYVETRGHQMMRGGPHNPRDPNIEQGLLYPGEPGFEAQVARGGYGLGLSPGSPGYDAINKANLAAKLSPEEAAELKQIERALLDNAGLEDARWGDTTGQATDSAKEYISADIDDILQSGQGIEGIRKLYRETVGSDFSPQSSPINSNQVLDDIDDIPF